jgi:ribosomal protein S18 acetylase RimI-like enzyme
MSAEVTIRPMEASDVEPAAVLLAELSRQFIIGEFGPAAQERFLAENNAAAIHKFVAKGFRYHVAESNGELVGFVGVRDNKHLYHLFVAKSKQRRGFGRTLWEFAKRDCVNNGHGGAFSVNSSNSAVPIYERFGFIRNGPAQNTNGVVYNPMILKNNN